MANQEDSACEIPLKRPRLDGTDCAGPPSQDGTLVDTCENKDTATPGKLGGPIVGTGKMTSEDYSYAEELVSSVTIISQKEHIMISGVT